MFMRGTNIQLRTNFSAGILPPLRQTASYLLASLRNGYVFGKNFKNMSKKIFFPKSIVD
jgi:membrane-bound metal-dependent hydrolase YbcI (DUF457 family)